ncbi:MAG: glycosyltransferase family 4 protein [Pseudomonadota bacterium]|nr:glycosyltransferase family 4 protein [Pseudomonadota bacterium]
MSELWFLPPLALVVCWLTLILLLRRETVLPMDHPNERSLHVRPTPRIGGLGIMAGLAICTLFLRPDGVLVLMLVALGLCALSLLDDLRGLSVRVRFAGHFIAAGAALYVLPDLPGWAWWLALPALVWMTNLYNFMDGSDGLAGGMALFGFASYGAAAWLGGAESLAVLAWVIAAASAGFLLFNFPPARVFMGDAGSIPLGYLAAALGLAGWAEGLWPIAFPVLVFSPFIVDASATLLRRLSRGEKIWQAHRSHYYQRLVRMGWSHRRLALAEYVVMAVAGVSGLAVASHPDWQPGIVLAWAVFYLFLAVVIDRRWKESGLAY